MCSSDLSIRNSVSSGIWSLECEGAESVGREHIRSVKTGDLVDLAVVNSKSNSCRITIHLEYLPPSNCLERIYVMGLQSETIVIVHKRM